MKNVLFLCSRNRLRSPTAETVFFEAQGYEVRSAGLSHDAIEPTTPGLVEWADYIFVMEKCHRNKLQQKFRKHLNGQKVICLDIPDDYEYMEEALVVLLKSKLSPFFTRKR